MADGPTSGTPRSEADLLTNFFQDGQANNAITTQRLRDLVASIKTINPEFITGLSNPAHKEGLLFYDDEHKALSYYNEATNVTINMGQEMVLRGTATEDLVDGDVIFISGAAGTEPTFTKAIASNNTPNILGIATNTFASGTLGYVTIFGLVHSIDTSGFSSGDTLYLSGSVLGGLTATAPSLPIETMIVGTVVDSEVNGHVLSSPVRVNFSNETTSILQVSHSASVSIAANTPTAVPFDTNDTIENITHVTPSAEIIIVVAGVYQIIAGFQITHIGGGGSAITTWVQIDTGSGFVDIDNTAVKQDLSNNDTRVLILNHIGRHDVGDKIRLMWNTTNVAGELVAVAADVGNEIPAIPSVIATITKLGIA